MNARGATLQGGKLTLTGVSPNSIVFADRPVRAAGHALTTHLLEEWAPGNTDSASFTKEPPNATVSAFSKDGSAIRDAVVVLKTPKLEGDRLTFDVDVLEGDLAGADGPASIFIDRFGFGGFHGGGFAAGGFHGGGFARPAALPAAATLTSALSVSAASAMSAAPAGIAASASARSALRQSAEPRSAQRRRVPITRTAIRTRIRTRRRLRLLPVPALLLSAT